MFFTDVLQCSIMVVGGIIVAIMSKKISFFLNVILFKFCFFLSLDEEYITSGSECFYRCYDFSQIPFVSLQGFNEVGGLDGLWNKFGTSMGKPLTSTVAPATTATSNFTTDASGLGTMTSSVVSSLPGNDTVGSCYKLTSYWGNLWRPLDDPDYPWLGLWTSLFITSVWYFCTDQVTTL